MFCVECEKYQNFLSENFHFLVIKFSVYLNRHVFEMNWADIFGSLFIRIISSAQGRTHGRTDARMDRRTYTNT